MRIGRVTATLAVLAISLSSCISLTVSQKKEYVTLMSDAASSVKMLRGGLNSSIYKALRGAGPTDTVQGTLPDRYMDVLKKFSFELNPDGDLYHLKLVDNSGLSLFNYDCTLGVDSTVSMAPGRLGLDSIGLYERCRQR
ncbi:MAG: hypothetical protein M1491_05220 [Deltaproteobacteria bacterium]|nr:hypothetical protein [Deltaproteobacteria bacterium]MCL5277419.1 hypothetical protein [Deltaproteobacteria bacterium]